LLINTHTFGGVVVVVCCCCCRGILFLLPNIHTFGGGCLCVVALCCYCRCVLCVVCLFVVCCSLLLVFFLLLFVVCFCCCCCCCCFVVELLFPFLSIFFLTFVVIEDGDRMNGKGDGAIGPRNGLLNSNNTSMSLSKMTECFT